MMTDTEREFIRRLIEFLDEEYGYPLSDRDQEDLYYGMKIFFESSDYEVIRADVE